MIKKYAAKISYDGRSHRYLAKVPDIPGCVTTGRTREEAIFNITDAATECIKVRIAVGIGIPKATPTDCFELDMGARSNLEDLIEEKVEIEVEI